VDISPGIPLQIGWHNTAPDRRVCVCVCVWDGEKDMNGFTVIQSPSLNTALLLYAWVDIPMK